MAVVTSAGSALSHSSILARSAPPLVVGATEALQLVNDGDVLAVDGGSGGSSSNPRDRAPTARMREEARTQATAPPAPHARRRGHHAVRQRQSREDVAEAHALGAAGIGLYRTEFLFLQRDTLPDEEEQFRAYRDVVLGMTGRTVTIRTLDIGADKADRTGLAPSGEANPALGVRGVRLSMAKPGLFETQLRAILRASGYGPLRVLVPMITSREEIVQVRALLDRIARGLRAEGHEIADAVPLGAMIEVPAAAIALPGLIGVVDFVSIGTNDLTQYLLAADRGNDALGDLYSPLHPAMLKLLHSVIRTARRAASRSPSAGKWRRRHVRPDPARTGPGRVQPAPGHPARSAPRHPCARPVHVAREGAARCCAHATAA